ncbi:hypothetical protein DM860_010774 [Cuscuta australis]|uniref:Protein GUCD1 n=1 Tax=Cuscuta australis TaxID=267555 RepID=A0A328DZW4_9ASTE|nr:hypothetical protein DM860_010774 [Cuscuta australis]
MWPIYLLFNKFSGAKEKTVQRSGRSKLRLIRPLPFIQSPTHRFLSRSVSIQVQHINQLHSWDCGLACVAMVLRTIGFSNCTIGELEELCCTRSIWTVDLAYLLQKYSADFYYFTVTLGANPNFNVESFYKEQLPTDLLRVNMLFQKAREAGIDVECRSVSAEEISLLILSRNYIAIALVDQCKLSHSWLEDLYVSSFCSNKPGYTGHYVVICGYDSDTDTFEIRDPASSQFVIFFPYFFPTLHDMFELCNKTLKMFSREHERVSSRCLEEARKAFGTDEDLLLVNASVCSVFYYHINPVKSHKKQGVARMCLTLVLTSLVQIRLTEENPNNL